MRNRLLILAPRGRDADVAFNLFERNEIAALVCRDTAALLEAIEIDAGAVMLTEEVLTGSDADRLADWIAAQPAWSDLPFIVLANGHRAPRSERALQRLQTLGNTVLLERPLHAEAMLGAVRSALKARSRQYQVRDSVAELRESERELRFTLQAGRLGAWMLDLSNDELTTSQTWRENFGRDPKAPFTHQQMLDAVHPSDRARVADAMTDSIATGADYDIEYRVVTLTGELRWVLIRARPAYTDDGTPLRMTGVSIDITDRKREEVNKGCLAELADAIRDHQAPGDLAYAAAEILGRALGVSRVGYGTIDPDAETLRVERDWTAPGVKSFAGVVTLRDYGSSIDSLKQGHFIAIADVREDDRTAIAAAALEGQSARSFVNAPVIEQGRLAAVLYVNDDHVREWTTDEHALIKEVGERTRTAVERSRVDAALRDSEARYRTLFESVDQGFCVFDMVFDDAGRPIDYVFVEVNPAFAAQTGLVDAVGRRMSNLAPAHEQRWYDLYGGVALTGTPVRIEDYAQALGRWYEIYAYRVGAPEQRRVAALFNDVSDRKSSEQRIHELNETLEQRVAERTAERNRVWEGSRDILVTADRNGVFRDVNPAWTRILGHAPGDVVGRSFSDFVWPDDRDATAKAVEAAGSGNDVEGFENRYCAQDGTPRWIAWRTAFEGDLIYGYGRDITAEKQHAAELALAQEALRQSQKMEAMGSLTGGVAHDFNNLLTPIVGSLDLLQRKGLGSEREQRLIAGAVQSADRAKTLVQRLLAFARRQPLQSTAVDLAPLVHGMADLIASTTGPQIKIVVEAADDLPAAKVDPNQLEMAILNLAVNARDAMPGGGTLRISVSSETAGPDNDAGIIAGRYLRLSIADTGSGMDEATLKRAIEPFFSTKGVGKGTGLGLSMAHGLASQLGGAMTISSIVGVGTNIELWIPESIEQMMDMRAGETATLVDASGVALLVDDDELVRLSTADMLIEMGFTVVEARSAEEALNMIDDGLHPDLLVTDHLMPGMSGTELARTLQRERPATKILVVSGYAESEGIDPDLPRLTKPFRNAELAESLALLG